MIVSFVKGRKTVHSCHFVELGLMPEMNGHFAVSVRIQYLDLGPDSPEALGSSRGKGDGDWIDLRIYVQESAGQLLGRQPLVVSDTAKKSFLLCEGGEEECP